MKLGPKLNFSNVLKRKFHSTESKAFSKSSSNKSPSVEFVSQKSKTSKINLAFSLIFLPLMYADCCLPISLSIIF